MPADGTAPVALVEGYPHVLQEIGRAGARAIGEAGFYCHGVAFSAGFGQVEGPGDGRPALANHITKPFEQPVAFQFFQLRLVAGFMGGQLNGPGERVRAIGVRHGVKVHARGCPAHRAVGIQVVRVQDDGHAPLPGRVADTAADGLAELLPQAGVAAGQGIGAFWIEELVMMRFQAVPAQAAGVVAGQVKLGPGPGGGQQEEQQRYEGFTHQRQK